MVQLHFYSIIKRKYIKENLFCTSGFTFLLIIIKNKYIIIGVTIVIIQ